MTCRRHGAELSQVTFRLAYLRMVRAQRATPAVERVLVEPAEAGHSAARLRG